MYTRESQQLPLRFWLDSYLVPQFRDRYFHELEATTVNQLMVRKNLDPELMILESIVPRSEYAIDVGSEQGHYTFILDRLTQGKVLALEPNRKHFRRLKRLFPHITLLPKAASDHTGTVPACSLQAFHPDRIQPPIAGDEIWLDTRLSKKPSLLTDRKRRHRKEPYWAWPQTIKRTSVPAITIDQAMARKKNRPVGFIRIHAGCWEAKIIDGTMNILAQHQPVLLIDCDSRESSQTVAERVAHVCQFGYEAFFLNLPEQKILPFKDFDAKIHQNPRYFGSVDYITNIIFIAKMRKPWFLQQTQSLR